jgi:hypothetical protein
MRKILLSIKIYGKFVWLRRKYKQLTLELERVKTLHHTALTKQKLNFEHQLAVERKRYELMMNAWADRFVNSNGLPSISPAAIDVESQVDDPEQQILLNSDQIDYFNDVKAQFWADGMAEGADNIEIEHRWKELASNIKADVLEQLQ